MKKLLLAFLLFATAFLCQNESNAQCQALFNVYQDTSIGAPAHHYIGNNNCLGANFPGIDTINYTYTWTWGDGTATTAPFPSHTYASTGNYTICLYMDGVPVIGCHDTLCINATINKNAAMATITIKNPYAAPTAVSDVNANQFALYPNPANDKLYIQGLQKSSYQIAIFSMEGKLVYSENLLDKNFVEINSLSKGNYIMKVIDANNTSSVLKFYKD